MNIPLKQYLQKICPACGKTHAEFIAVCPSCGNDLRLTLKTDSFKKDLELRYQTMIGGTFSINKDQQLNTNIPDPAIVDYGIHITSLKLLQPLVDREIPELIIKLKGLGISNPEINTDCIEIIDSLQSWRIKIHDRLDELESKNVPNPAQTLMNEYAKLFTEYSKIRIQQQIHAKLAKDPGLTAKIKTIGGDLGNKLGEINKMVNALDNFEFMLPLYQRIKKRMAQSEDAENIRILQQYEEYTCFIETMQAMFDFTV